MIPKLILVEGLPGCGKSTTAQFLARQLRRDGHRARWHYEEETPHPVLKTRYTGSTWEGYVADRVARWAEFVAEVASSDEARIVESTLCQTPMMTMLRENVDGEAIVACLRRIQAALAPLAPLLVYLRHQDPDEALRTIAALRGDDWQANHVRRFEQTAFAASRGLSGVPGLLAYWREHAAIAERAIGPAIVSTLVLDVTDGDWGKRARVVLDRMGVPVTAHPSVPEMELRRFVGRYRGGPGGTRECSVTLRDGRLVLDGLLWPANPLLPTSPALFEAESWPFEIRFEHDDTSAASIMRVTGPALGWGHVDGVYERV